MVAVVSKEELIKTITSAFASVKCPDDQIVVGDIDCGHDCYYDAAKVFRGRQSIDEIIADLDDNADHVHFLSDEGFHYYFPKLMTAALENPQGSVFEAVLYYITNKKDEIARSFEHFNTDQREAIRQYFAFVAAEFGPLHMTQKDLDRKTSFWQYFVHEKDLRK